VWSEQLDLRAGRLLVVSMVALVLAYYRKLQIMLRIGAPAVIDRIRVARDTV
jgi:hypothetical protein